MRVTLIVFASLFLLISAGVGFVLGYRNFKDADDLAEHSAELEMAKALGIKEAAGLASVTPSKLKLGGAVAGLAAMAALALLVMTFAKKAVVPSALVVFGLCAVAIFTNPHYETGPFGPASARSIAIVFAVLCAAGTLAAFGAEKIRQIRLARG
jgi:hypothetical protein